MVLLVASTRSFKNAILSVCRKLLVGGKEGMNKKKEEQNHRVSSEKNHPMVPNLDHFQWKIKIADLLPDQLAPREDHFLQT